MQQSLIKATFTIPSAVFAICHRPSGIKHRCDIIFISVAILAAGRQMGAPAAKFMMTTEMNMAAAAATEVAPRL